MNLKIYQVDAFASRVFEGNPAAVVPLDEWLPDKTLQAIAMENNLSETAFFVSNGHGFRLRWFTPEAEVDLCGHATLAAAHVLFSHLGRVGPEIRFQSNSGELRVRHEGRQLCLDFPAIASRPCQAPAGLVEGLGAKPDQVLAGTDYMAVFDDPARVASLAPDFSRLAGLDLRGVIVTAAGADCDFVSRCFYPSLAVSEDPVTGSAHCQLTPYWAKRLGRTRLTARQLSRRGGYLDCEQAGKRILLRGQAVTYLEGTITLPT
ncbi:MAG: PhzF family phenazine biosynthesis protein [Wenzhouxiangella sp.]|nr:MAG: PhzF family phenazine biosynthesis protein [Wenzhouxiangella sp.]